MRTLFKAALACILACGLSTTVLATEADDLLAKIDADIDAKRLSTPEGNNAIEKIWQFRDLVPYDQRINSRVQQVGSVYVDLANRSISSKRFSQAQSYLDSAWGISYLTPGLESTQDKLDKLFSGSSAAKKQFAAKKAPAAPKQVAAVAPKKVAPKKDDSKEKAHQAQLAKEKARQAQLAKQKEAARLAKQKADAEAASKRRIEAEARERRLAMQRQEENAKLEAAAKLAELNAQREKAELAAKAINEAEETSKPIAGFNLDQELIEDRETREIRTALEPICQEIINNDASVVLHTQSTQDYRWLTVRLTLCVRRIDKGFRLRHSHQQVADASPSISLHPGRGSALLKEY
ncbi:hypothetical protein NBRC116188_19440 [Oceaniserpentilla sp. 4NH20-0058]|uniref:hypothetical protein n=1 Tax=Oceaniserpentilla sp. 4NH20-0058 TaxID=3127660 RepID=UPI00310545FE